MDRPDLTREQQYKYLTDPVEYLVGNLVQMYEIPEPMARFLANHWEEYLSTLPVDPREAWLAREG